MAYPKPGPLVLADGDTVTIERVWYTTSPPGTYRVSYKRPGAAPRGCKAWFRKGSWTEYQENDQATDDDRRHAREVTEDLF